MNIYLINSILALFGIAPLEHLNATVETTSPGIVITWAKPDEIAFEGKDGIGNALCVHDEQALLGALLARTPHRIAPNTFNTMILSMVNHKSGVYTVGGKL